MLQAKFFKPIKKNQIKLFASLKARRLIEKQLSDIKRAGLWKNERVLISQQSSAISVEGTQNEVLNFCANNYLGLSNDYSLMQAAKRTIDSHGLGLVGGRPVCGTQDIHKELEEKISKFHRKEDTLLYGSCFDANTGLFEGLIDPKTDEKVDLGIISDALNHASIIDGVRLAGKATRLRYNHCDMKDLEEKLKKAQKCDMRIIITDGVFSMDGDVPPLKDICDLANRYDSLVCVDESHATGFFGKTGRGAAEHCGVLDRVDIINSTLGKAMGGSAGGFTTGPKYIVDILRQRSRPYLFSNTITPVIVGAAIKAFDTISESTELRDKLEENTLYFRKKMTDAGFKIMPGVHPIIPIMLYEGRLANEFADEMLKRGIYVIGFSYPVVPKGQARIRVQISAKHTKEQLDKAINAFIEVGKSKKVI